MSNIRNKTSTFQGNVPAETVITAILDYASFRSLFCLMNRKDKSLKQCFYRNNMQCQKLQVFEVLSFSLHTGPQIGLPLVYCPVNVDTLFGVSP